MKTNCFIFVITTLFYCNFRLNAQVLQSIPIDILSGLDDGKITATSEPSLTINTVENIFDGNPYTEAGIRDDSTASITLQFHDEVKFSKCKVFFWNDGQWSLEIANSLDDLNGKSGSYQSLVDNQDNSFFNWDSSEFSPVAAKYIRLTENNLNNIGVHFGEWELQAIVNFTSLIILPYPLKLVPNTSLQLKVEILDENGVSYPYNFPDVVHWSSSNTSIADISEMGKIHTYSLGTAVITAKTTALSGTTIVNVVPDFESVNDETLYLKVALVLQNPVIDSTNMQKIHQVWGWTDPIIYTNQLVEEFSMMSDGVVQFQIVEIHDDEGIFTRLGGELMSIDTLAYYYLTPGKLYGRNTPGTLQNLAESQGKVRFDYNEMIDYYDFDTKRNSGVIDEIWVYAHPFAGMYESQLVGPGAFWWNSPPLDNPNLEKLLSVMGWNYERGLDCAIHSVGHRVESAIRHVYGRWDCQNPEPTNWELFTRIDKDMPDQAHIGNIHFPPNGQSDYDYSNTRYVITYADNWKRYPILLDQTRNINCSEWGCTHLGYMRWWFNHLPRYTGVTDGVLNNWWYYFVDYEGAVERAEQLMSIDENSNHNNNLPGDFRLEQNYPNPFNSETRIEYKLINTGAMELAVYNIIGQRIRTLKNGYIQSGSYNVTWNGKNDLDEPVPSGIYFYRLSTSGGTNLIKKMILLK
ncbi:MAG: T9SS type A sorting domain-containing protein [Candidatus Marinimicrobia bacterium]|nr:T9SS type A sorting domain-containing protein [Candidatus Neomarinimicrobiota bacterium]